MSIVFEIFLNGHPKKLNMVVARKPLNKKISLNIFDLLCPARPPL